MSLSDPTTSQPYTALNAETLKKAYETMCVAREMNRLCEENIHLPPHPFSSGRGHEAVQIAAAMQLRPQDYCFPYHRDEALLIGLGVRPYDLMLQLLARKDDPFSGGRMPYPNAILHHEDAPEVPLPTSVFGSHVVQATGLAQGLMYLLSQNLRVDFDRPVVLCCLGDAAATRGEVAEAFQVAVLKRLPVVYLVQDNDWAGAVRSDEIRAVDAYELAGGFKGMKRVRLNGADFVDAYDKLQVAFEYVRLERMPVVLHAKCPLLAHHDSRTQRETYRSEENLALHRRDEPLERLRRYLVIEGVADGEMAEMERQANLIVIEQFEQARMATEPEPGNVMLYRFAPSPVIDERGLRQPTDAPFVTFREAGIQAVAELLDSHPAAVYLGDQISSAKGGVFGEAAGLAARYGPDRVVSMPPGESYLVGCAAGLSAAGTKPIVGVSSPQRLMTALHQLNRLSECHYLTMGKTAVSAVLRVSVEKWDVETILLQLKGLKIACPSTAADLKGLLKTAFDEANPVVMLEHADLYDLPEAGSAEPSGDYRLPFGKARVALTASDEKRADGQSLAVVTYGIGVHWSVTAAAEHPGSVEVLDLRTLHPLDWEAVIEAVKRHGKALVVTAEPQRCSFAEGLAGRIAQQCFRFLDAPVWVCGSASVPAPPVSPALLRVATCSPASISEMIGQVLNF
ncbi:MAG: thiamine pyrophosphate-dependent enzyme [Cytophagales bacterium]|jgi:2-oxoisovalerate dehydrogenase E1 component|nr:thiamine pyrophosphate-dependent enzyme [Cytophagales bacterium]